MRGCGCGGFFGGFGIVGVELCVHTLGWDGPVLRVVMWIFLAPPLGAFDRGGCWSAPWVL